MLTSFNPEAAHLYLESGELYVQQGKLEEAALSYQRALLSQPGLAEAHLALGKVLQQLQRWEDAARELTRAIALKPELANGETHWCLGVTFLEQGQLALAATHLEQVKSLQPDRPELSERLAELYLKQGKLTAAIAAYQQAIQQQPQRASLHWQLALVLQKQATFYQQQALDLKPALADVTVHFEQGIQFANQNQFDLAVRAYGRAIALKPDWAEAHCNLGNAYAAVGQTEEAIKSLRRAIALNPKLIEAYSNLGNNLVRLGDFEAAIQAHQRAIALKPDWAELHFNLGDTLSRYNRWEEAMACFQRAIALKPELAEAQRALGNLYLSRGEYDQAVQHHQRAIALKPDWAEAHHNLAKVLAATGRSDEAIWHYQKAVELSPQWIQALWDLGFEYWQRDLVQDAIACFQKILAIEPRLADIHQNLCVLLRMSGDFLAARQAADRYVEYCRDQDPVRVSVTYVKAYLESGLNEEAQAKFLQLEDYILQNPNNLAEREIRILYEDMLFSLPYLRDQVKSNTHLCKLIGQQYADHCASAIGFAGQAGPLKEETTKVKTAPSRRQGKSSKVGRSPLRIGFISKHFRRHSVGWCSRAIIRELGQLTPHLYLYFTGRSQLDDLTQEFRRCTEHFIYCPDRFPNQQIDAATLVDQIQHNHLDVLIDMDSVMNPLNAVILHYSPARLCFSWLGCEAPFISANNYYLCDWHSHPASVDAAYREKLIRMPDSGVAIGTFEVAATPRDAARAALGITPDQVAYLCVATGHKMNRSTIQAVVHILKEVPNSVFLHKGFCDVQVFQTQFQQECASQGVDFQRCKFLSRTSMEEDHRTNYLLADVLLDTYPYNGGTHNLEALWFELPVVTIVGEQGPSRLGHSFMQVLQMPEGQCQNWVEYQEWAIRLGRDATLRQQLKQRLYRAKQTATLSPLWNPHQFAQDVYKLFETM